MKRFKKVLLALCKGILVLVIIGALANGIASAILGHRLEAEIARIKATGVPMAMADLGKPKVPDAENAAVIYAKIIKDLTGQVLNPNGGPSKSTPNWSGEDMDAIEKLTSTEPNERTTEIWDEAQKAVAKYKHLIPLLEEAASRPKCQFPTNWEAGTAALFPHFASMRRISRFLRANALIQARDGNIDEAVHSIELSFKVSDSLKDEPSLIGQLVRIAMLKIASLSLREVLSYGNISEAQAKRFYDTLSQIDMYPGINKAMQGERCFGLSIFDQIRKQPDALWQMTESGDESTNIFTASRFLRYVLLDIARPVFYADELTYLKLLDRELEMMRLPYREMHSKMAALDAETQTLPRYKMVSRVLFPIFGRATAIRDAAAAETAGSQILLALQVYKSRHGIYPATLDELRAGLGWDIPKDVFSNKDFIYKCQGNGFLLYSVGQNFKDDGARIYPAPKSPSAVYLPGPDAPPPPPSPPEDASYKMADGRLCADIVWQMGN